MADTYLVVFTDDFPADLLAGRLVSGDLDRLAGGQPAIRCSSLVQEPGCLVELIPEEETQHGGLPGAVYVQQRHILLVLKLAGEKIRPGFG